MGHSMSPIRLHAAHGLYVVQACSVCFIIIIKEYLNIVYCLMGCDIMYLW
jgi:hypothetical protein